MHACKPEVRWISIRECTQLRGKEKISTPSLNSFGWFTHIVSQVVFCLKSQNKVSEEAGITMGGRGHGLPLCFGIKKSPKLVVDH